MGGREPLSRNIDHWDLRLGRCVLTIHQNIMINISQRVNWRAFAIHAMFLPSSAIFLLFLLVQTCPTMFIICLFFFTFLSFTFCESPVQTCPTSWQKSAEGKSGQEAVVDSPDCLRCLNVSC